MILWQITKYKDYYIIYRDDVLRTRSEAQKEIHRLIREDFAKGLIASKPRLNHVYHVKPVPSTLAAFAQSGPDENGHTTDYLYQMDEVWPDDEKERNKIIRRRHLDCFVQYRERRE